MVRLAVSKLGQVRPHCLSRPMLFAAQHSLEQGNAAGAGVQLREAYRRFLVALCKYHDCMPEKKCRRTSMGMARALKQAKHLDHGVYVWVRDAVKLGNKAAHCCYVRPSLLEASVAILHFILDNSPELEIPTRGGVL